MLRRMTPSSAQLTGGDLSVDILHTEDSVALGDGTNLIGTFALVESKRALPVQSLGVSKTKLTDSLETDFAEIEDVGGEKALKVSVIASVGGGGGGTAATDSAAFTATATQGTPIMGALDDVSSDALAEGEMGIVRMTSARAMHVSVQNASIPVTGTFWQATQPVSGTVTVGNASLAVTGTFWQATQPVSGTVAFSNTTIAVTNAGTFATQESQILADNAGFTDGTTKLFASGYIFDEVAGTALTENDIAAARVDSKRAQVFTLEDATTRGQRATVSATGAVKVDGSAVTQPVSGTFWQATQPVSGTFWQATQPVSLASLPTLAAGTNNIGDVDVLTLPSIPAGTNNIGDVDVLTLPAVAGGAAHDAAITGNPVPVGYRAKSANPTSVADGDVTYPMADLAGRIVTQPFAPRELITPQSTTITASTSETTIVTAAGASTYADLVLLTITNSSSTALIVTLKDSTAGTTRGIFALAANGGIVIPYPTPLPQSSTNANWTLTCGTSVSSIYVHAVYVKRV